MKVIDYKPYFMILVILNTLMNYFFVDEACREIIWNEMLGRLGAMSQDCKSVHYTEKKFLDVNILHNKHRILCL